MEELIEYDDNKDSSNDDKTKNRSRSDIITEILSLIEGTPQSKTKIMYKAYLSYTQMKFYSKYLIERGLVRQLNEKWTLTEKGRRYLDAYRKAEEILNS